MSLFMKMAAKDINSKKYARSSKYFQLSISKLLLKYVSLAISYPRHSGNRSNTYNTVIYRREGRT